MGSVQRLEVHLIQILQKCRTGRTHLKMIISRLQSRPLVTLQLLPLPVCVGLELGGC